MTSPKVVLKCEFKYALNSPDRFHKISSISASNKIRGMFNYLSNAKKRAINMFDYYAGKINKIKRANLVIEDGTYATDFEIEKRKKEYLKYFENSHLWQGLISFNNDYIDKSIELEKFEEKMVKEIMPSFLKYCGFKDINKMSYQVALHTNTNHYHFHYSFIEKEPNYVNSDGKTIYRRRGMMSKTEKQYLKNIIIHSIDRHREFTPLVIKTNKEIEDLKKYFKNSERNFILKNYDDIILEENILNLGKMLYEKRNGKETKIKYSSIDDKEIKKLTTAIKKYLFKNKNSELYKKNEEFKKSLDKINDYFLSLSNDNHIIQKDSDSKYTKEKEKYIDNYICNAIVDNAYHKYKKLKNNKQVLNENDIIQEAVLKMYNKNKKQSRYTILVNYLSNINKNNQFKNRYKIEQSIKNINSEMEEAISEFRKLFKTDTGKEETI